MVDVDEEVRRYEALKTKRGTWEAHWEEAAWHVLPRHVGFTGKREAGEKRTGQIYDSSPVIALERFAAVTDSMLTPRQQMWHILRPSDPVLAKSKRVQEFMYQVSRRMYQLRYQPKANFSGQNIERWTSMGAFGNGPLFIDKGEHRGFRYRAIALKNLFLMQNHQGIIDTVYRRCMFSPRQAAQMWGRDKLPDKISAALDNPSQIDSEFEFVHVVRPRTDYNPSNLDASSKPYTSIYISIEGKQLMSEGGYDAFPYSISRYVTAPEEVYGRGPAMQALSDIKMLNAMGKVDIRASHRLVDPPMLVSDDGVLSGGGRKIDMRPGGVIYGGLDSNGRDRIKPYSTGARLDVNDAKMEQRRRQIDDAFLVTLFQILVESPRMTATEALIRAQEKGMLLTPTMGRQQSEALGPMIERELALMAEQDLFPSEVPPELLEAQGEYEIVYDSPMSRMQRAEELVGVQRTMEVLAPFMQIDPSILEIFDRDKLAALAAEVSGVPPTVLRSEEELAEMREQAAQAQAIQEMVQGAPQVAGALKDAAQAQALVRQ